VLIGESGSEESDMLEDSECIVSPPDLHSVPQSVARYKPPHTLAFGGE